MEFQSFGGVGEGLGILRNVINPAPPLWLVLPPLFVMPIQKLPLDVLQKVRQHIKTALALPEAEQDPRSRFAYDTDDDSEPPEPDSLSDLGCLFSFGGPSDIETQAPNVNGKWFISSLDPAAALMKLPGVKLKPTIRFVSYLYRTEQDGIGSTWAVPEALSTTAILERALSPKHDRAHPPQPEGALADVMDALEGDRSAISFVIAGLLRRELKELGATGQSAQWVHHRLINAPPPQAKWDWKVKPPQDLSPKVLIYPDQRAVVEFFTCRVTAPVAIYQHIDQFSATHYKAASVDRAIALLIKKG